MQAGAGARPRPTKRLTESSKSSQKPPGSETPLSARIIRLLIKTNKVTETLLTSLQPLISGLCLEEVVTQRGV